MSLFRHRVRPLSAAGRVLICMALSVLAALLLLVSPPAHADDSPTPQQHACRCTAAAAGLTNAAR